MNGYSYFSLFYNNFQRFPDLVPVPISAADLHIVYASTGSLDHDEVSSPIIYSREFTEHNLDTAYTITVTWLVYNTCPGYHGLPRAHNPFVARGWALRRGFYCTLRYSKSLYTYIYRRTSMVTTYLCTFSVLCNFVQFCLLRFHS